MELSGTAKSHATKYAEIHLRYTNILNSGGKETDSGGLPIIIGIVTIFGYKFSSI